MRVCRALPGMLAAIASASLVLLLNWGAALAAQTPLPAAAQPVPVAEQPQSAPTPTPEATDKIESLPAYSPNRTSQFTAAPAYGTQDTRPAKDRNGSAYIPVDSWIYPAMLRLYSLGFADTEYLALRPYTRRSVLHILQQSEGTILSSNDAQAQEILSALLRELTDEGVTKESKRGTIYGVESVYTRMMGVDGPILSDSYHLGQTFSNDYGRPHQSGFNNVTGFTTLNEQGPFSLFVRGEYQHAPAAAGYSQALAATLASNDLIPNTGYNQTQATIPAGPIASENSFRLVEATLSYHWLGNEISGGKSDAWLGPGLGGAMPWSNNAENIYSFRFNRVEPIRIKFLSRYLGPVRYDFFYGSLKGHTDPNDDWVHSEMFSFQPTANFQFGLQRTVIFGGKGHEPVTLHNFLHGFFDANDTNNSEKTSRTDPGARFSAFEFSYRLPYMRNYLTLYTDSEAHDDLDPISAPRRAAYRPGIYLSHFPAVARLDLRVEGVSTDCSTLACQGGFKQYFEIVQRQGYTNKGTILGDWIGREAKGGQAWLNYHLSGSEWIGIEFLHKQTPNDFIPGGTTQNQFRVDAVKHIGSQLEMHAWFQHERWVAPIYRAGVQNDNAITVQATFFPKLKTIAP